MENTVDFDVLGRAQDLKYMARDQNRIDFLTIIQSAATFQNLALFSIPEFVNVHTHTSTERSP